MSAKKLSFEQQLEALESIVDKLEKGELPLETSLAEFEKGVKLTRECQALLDQAQQKVAILSQDNQSQDGQSQSGVNPTNESLQEFSKD